MVARAGLRSGPGRGSAGVGSSRRRPGGVVLCQDATLEETRRRAERICEGERRRSLSSLRRGRTNASRAGSFGKESWNSRADAFSRIRESNGAAFRLPFGRSFCSSFGIRSLPGGGLRSNVVRVSGGLERRNSWAVRSGEKRRDWFYLSMPECRRVGEDSGGCAGGPREAG